jgi:type I restriction enzyme R subunit
MSEIAIPSVNSGVNLAQYRKRVESFIKENDSHVTIAKLKKGLPLTSSDLSELEKFVFNAQEVESQDKFKECFGAEQTLPHFIRSLVGLDKQTVQQAFSKYLEGTTYNATQIRFIEMIIEQLTSLGTLEASRLYNQPFTNMNPRGVEGIFNLKDADEIFNIVDEFNQIEVA